MIRLVNVEKTYFSKAGDIAALKKTNIEVKEGEIFGIIGLSGAGKSTKKMLLIYIKAGRKIIFHSFYTMLTYCGSVHAGPVLPFLTLRCSTVPAVWKQNPDQFSASVP